MKFKLVSPFSFLGLLVAVTLFASQAKADMDCLEITPENLAFCPSPGPEGEDWVITAAHLPPQ